jgi:plasmid replication initiation protein
MSNFEKYEVINMPDISIKPVNFFNDEQKKMIGLFIAAADEKNLDKEVTIFFKTLTECLGLTDEEIIKIFKLINSQLLEVSLHNERKEYVINIFSFISYDLDHKTVTFKFNNSIDGLYFELKKMYQERLKFKVSKLKGKYSWQVYEILKNLEDGKKYYISIEYLKYLLKIDSAYKLYADFKRKVILYTQNEIENKTDIHFEFEEKKEDKKIIGLYIIVHKKLE